MRHGFLIIVFVIVILTTFTAGQSGSDATLAFVGGRIYASPTTSPIDNGVVIVRAGKIVEVGQRQSVNIPVGAAIVDFSGKVITAGFANSYVHFTEDQWVGAANQPVSKHNQQLHAMLVRYGFTTVVDTASILSNTVALRQRIDSREVAGPRILTAGLAAYPPGGIPYYVKEAVPAELLKLLPQPSTAEQAMDFVRQNVDGGADIIKLFTGSWVTRQSILPMPTEVAIAAVAEAHRRGKLVFTHPSNVAGLEVALQAKVDVLAHAIEDTRGLTADHLRRMKAQKMALIPTLHLFRGNNIQEILREVRDYQRSGADVLFGTDVGFLPDYDPTDEFIQMTRAGLTWREILASLTTTPAARFGEASKRGRVASGLDADLVVLAHDPAADVGAFAEVVDVIRGGKSIFRQGQK